MLLIRIVLFFLIPKGLIIKFVLSLLICWINPGLIINFVMVQCYISTEDVSAPARNMSLHLNTQVGTESEI